MNVFRVQDKDGRGPFKPRFSHLWVDPEGDDSHRPSVMEEFGWDFRSKIPNGHHCGCAFRQLDQLNRWFSPTELIKLEAFGYRIVELEVNCIVFESESQLVFSRVKPLSKPD